MQSEKTDLNSFLKTLPTEAAVQAKIAAVKIDELEQVAQDLQGVEKKYTPWILLSFVLFVCSIVILFGSGGFFGLAQNLMGGLGVTAMAAALPFLGIVYAYHVRERTKADRAKLELNRTYFMSYGGYYFPSSETGQGHVFLIKEAAAQPYNPRGNERVRPGWHW